jgi:hypothetical protein
MNIPSKGKIRIKINTLHMYAPIIKSIVASFYPVQDVDYPWGPWIAWPYGSFERGQKVLISTPSALGPEDHESIEGVFDSEETPTEITMKIGEEIGRHYGVTPWGADRVCSIEVNRT